MTEPATEQPATASTSTSPQPPLPTTDGPPPPSIAIDGPTSPQHHQQQPPPQVQPPQQPFAPIYTLVNNTSTRTTHHPHVRYIFSDDDPDVLTQALAEHHEATTIDGLSPSNSDPAAATASNSSNRAVILDIATDDNGAYHVSWASSLSPSWAVLDAQLSHISPPSSSDGGNENDDGGARGAGGANINANANANTNASNSNSNNENASSSNSNKPGRLMLRIEGVESSGLGSESGSRHSGEASRQGSGIASGGGSGTGSRERASEPDDYAVLVDEFEKRMVTLRKVVSANEERLQNVTVEPSSEEATGSQQALEGGASLQNEVSER